MNKVSVLISFIIIRTIPIIAHSTSPNSRSSLTLAKYFGSINGFTRDASNGERLQIVKAQMTQLRDKLVGLNIVERRMGVINTTGEPIILSLLIREEYC